VDHVKSFLSHRQALQEHWLTVSPGDRVAKEVMTRCCIQSRGLITWCCIR
jgi:hypothetical protein